MKQIEKILLPGEEIRSKISYGGITLASTNRGVFISKGNVIVIVPPRHIYGIIFQRNLTKIIIGIFITIMSIINLSLTLAYDYMFSDFIFNLMISISLILLTIGVGLIIYGFLRRYELKIIYANGIVLLKGGGKMIKTVKSLRKIIEI